MITGLVSGRQLADDMTPFLDRTISQLRWDESLVGSFNPIEKYAILPTFSEIESYIESGEAEREFGRRGLESYEDSYIRTTMLLHHNDLRNPAVSSVNLEPCCDAAIIKIHYDRMTPRDVFGFVVRPGAVRLLPRERQNVNHDCPVHGSASFLIPALIAYTDETDENVPLSIYDIFNLINESTHLTKHVLFTCTVLDILNAYGIETSYQKNSGFNTHFYAPNGKFEALYESFAEVAPHGRTLTWIMLAGWSSGSARTIQSRRDFLAKLMETHTELEILEYLRAGVKHIRDIPAFVKAGVDLSTIKHAFSIGVFSPKLMKSLNDEGIDFSIMTALMEGEAA